MSIPFRSEIRQSTIDELLEKVSKKNYNKYLNKIKFTKIRGFKDTSISFDFPVTAIIGRNGSGKTTVLGAAACLYKDIKPRQFFTKSSDFDESMREWGIEYEAIDKTVNTKEFVKRTATFSESRWRRDALDRTVKVYGVSRTVPPTEKLELLKFASLAKTDASEVLAIADTVHTAVAKILDKDISKFQNVRIGSDGKFTLLAGETPDGDAYSEFHFGAGESSVIRMVMDLESIDDGSLVLIEEIENGLHPVATIKMVEYLIELSERKKIQAIFTTHSNEALAPLPNRAIWAVEGKELKQGRLDVKLLRDITGRIEVELAVYVEDDFARQWVELVISRDIGNIAGSIGVFPMYGSSKAVAAHKARKDDPASTKGSLCYLDGDAPESAQPEAGIFKLPGQAPETYIYGKVREKIDESAALLAAAMQLDPSNQKFMKEIVEKVYRINRDHHLLFNQIGIEAGFKSETVSIGAFLSTWAQYYPEELKELYAPIKQEIDKIRDSKKAN